MCDAWAEATRRNAFEWRNLQEQAAAQKKPEVRVVVTGVK